ncbi:DUF4383 domain-containing protein [Saccharomonospora cyanea]|uniref:DUF4383 domain-containing protein n=1 Tax=Saccharomonospora cyanea NA-134 TaxID=882082 RepID=H5XDE9_9PSEU|nr:DUF4383 domain-containing protein [Saccharomonospora cyanea]EHR60241.1 hypothetical protein SaccyDRAFT_1332 [Saccharomonospora cyanea NA-134]
MRGSERAHPPAAALRLTVLVIGLAYLVLGISGFALVGSDMGYDPSRTVWVFGISGLLNIGHTGVGALGVAAAHTEATARAFGWLSFFGFAGIFAYSMLAITVSPLGNLANVHVANVCLYGVTAVLGLLISVVPSRGGAATGHAT